VSLSADATFEPVSIAPDVWYGVSPRITVGLVHSSRAMTGFLGGAGDGLCLTGEEGGCAGVYDRVGVVGRLHVADRVLTVSGGPISLAVDGGLVVASFDPLLASAKLGVAARWQRGKLIAELSPNLWLGLTERDRGNGERLHLPLTVSYALTRRIAVAGQTGMLAPLEHFKREVIIGLSAGAQVMVTEQILVDVVFSLPRWLDTNTETYGLDRRTLTVGVGRAF
jgi:hypothetical protein